MCLPSRSHLPLLSLFLEPSSTWGGSFQTLCCTRIALLRIIEDKWLSAPPWHLFQLLPRGILPCLPPPLWDLWWGKDHSPCNPEKGEDPWGTMDIHWSSPMLHFNSEKMKPGKSKWFGQSHTIRTWASWLPAQGSSHQTTHHISEFSCRSLLQHFGFSVLQFV